MDGVVVKRFYGGGGNGDDDRCRLSVLSPVDLSPKVACVNLSLPSYIDDKHITCGSCCGLFYFVDFEGNIVLCNLTTKHLKPLPALLKVKPRFKFFAGGLGYDSKSDDFKVIRYFGQPYYNGSVFRGYKDYRWELYSLKSGVWKDIPTPDASVFQLSGVYVGGRCYWTAYLESSFGGSSSKLGFDILSFDFTTESFHCLHSPPLSSNTVFDLVEYRGSLGAIGFSRPGDATRGFGFEFWVREECSWTKVFDVVLFKVEREPLGLMDGRFLFLERKCRSNELLYQLVVYDRITKEWKELDIYDYDGQMKVSFYVEGQVALPDAIPMERSYTHEEEEQIKKRRRERLVWMSMSRAKLLSSDDDDSCEDEEDDDGSGECCKSTDDEDEGYYYRSGDSSGECCKSTNDEDESYYRSGDSSGESCKGTDDEDKDEDEEEDDMIDDDDDDTSMIIDDDDDYDDDD